MSAPPAGPSRSVRSLALGILIRVERDRAHAAPLLDARGRGLPPRDRDLLRALVKKALRGAIRLDHVLARSCDRPIASLDAETRAALRLGAAQILLMDRIPPHAAVGETVDAVKQIAPKAAGLVNAVLRKVASKEERPGAVVLPAGVDPLVRLALETSHPEWLVRRWVADLGESGSRAALAADDLDAAMDLLADPRAGSVDEIRARLAGDGIATEPSAWAPLALSVSSGDAAGHPLVTSGALAVVDAAAQALCELVAPSDAIVDLAAAPGGKTRTLLARGLARRVVALERAPSRAARLAGNLAASGRAGEAWIVRADSSAPPLARGRFDSILLDAPCSGTGTLRKNPEIRLRLSPSDLAGFASVQRALLGAALDLLAPGGRLTYVTCSLEPEENEEAVDAVLSARTGFAREDGGAVSLPAPLAACARGGGLFRVPPGALNDGFSALTITRRRGR
jgi:16S rRNA (cytosine967-C5)-methyltransferase